MALPLAGLADALRAAGLHVVELPGWQTRGQTDGPFAPRAVMWHHDASAPGDSPGVPQMMANLDNNGAQCWVDRYGTWHMVAAGRMWHAGSGGGWGRIPAAAGNTYAVGIETDHTTGEDWPTVQVSSVRRGTAVLLRYLGASPGDALCGHKEYRITNPDPDGLDMANERRAVAAIMDNPQEDDIVDAAQEDRIAAKSANAVFGRAIPLKQFAGGVVNVSMQGAMEYLDYRAQSNGAAIAAVAKQIDAQGAVLRQISENDDRVTLDAAQLQALNTTIVSELQEIEAAHQAALAEQTQQFDQRLDQLADELAGRDATAIRAGLKAFFAPAVEGN